MAIEASPDSTITEIVGKIQVALREAKCIGSERIVRHGLSMTHFHLLVMLERHGDMSMSRLAELLDVSMSNATGLVDRLEERGLIERSRVPDDRRVVLVRVSEEGRRIMEEVDVLRSEFLQKVLGRLDARQLERVARSVEDVSTAFLAALEDEPEGFWFEHVHGGNHGTVTRTA